MVWKLTLTRSGLSASRLAKPLERGGSDVMGPLLDLTVAEEGLGVAARVGPVPLD